MPLRGDDRSDELTPVVSSRARVWAGRALPVSLLLVASPARAVGQLEIWPDFLGVLPVLVGAFVVVTLVLNPLLFQPLLAVMDQRAERIEGARRRADQVDQRAAEALARYEQAIRAAHEAASAERRRRLDASREELLRITREAKADAEREIERARDELGASVREARASLRDDAGELATLAAERILGRSL
jgi:F-type H+-transporting ATPase subunit b